MEATTSGMFYATPQDKLRWALALALVRQRSAAGIAPPRGAVDPLLAIGLTWPIGAVPPPPAEVRP